VNPFDADLKHLCPTSRHPIGLRIIRAEGSYLYTEDGCAYLDFISGIGVANIGHTHPAVVAAIRAQAAAYLHVMVYGEYLQAPQIRLAARLTALLPRPLSVVYFTNSGAEANEGALKVAKKFTGRSRLVGFHGGFHGDTHGACSVTGRDLYRKPFAPLLPQVTFLPFDDVTQLRRIDDRVAAVIVEPIQGEGGIRVPSDRFLPALRARCSEVGALLIFDEVQTGIGRTGKYFAMEHSRVVPDIVTLAKALGGGMPLGAFVGRRNIMKTLSRDPPLSHVTTFGGHPVCCAAALAGLDVLEKEDLPARAAKMGAQLASDLRALAAKFRSIVDVRGMGMMLGLEMSSAAKTARLVRRARALGLILGWTLHSDRTIRISPPLTLSDAERAQGISIIRAALDEG